MGCEASSSVRVSCAGAETDVETGLSRAETAAKRIVVSAVLTRVAVGVPQRASLYYL